MQKERGLDEIDRRILRAQRKQARLTNNELAEKVGLSASSLLDASETPGGDRLYRRLRGGAQPGAARPTRYA